ncbi:hypothetical protein NLM33_42840 [Bradyrhizobium sp. CCGUVB1N3]|uniref:hypothetical protein n=1 Tax=Bradyrhizobium sp. CCGUVB1N3 TaxID=2949629 RepID=UPI0020B1EBBC|nr:hypothetical protein [Bradyrhizobium sp. CCGUVB1N3]MCP3476899.1 hypothetical protein [Bradyrhizobium sp. CCGUVB1N3]
MLASPAPRFGALEPFFLRLQLTPVSLIACFDLPHQYLGERIAGRFGLVSLFADRLGEHQLIDGRAGPPPLGSGKAAAGLRPRRLCYSLLRRGY